MDITLHYNVNLQFSQILYLQRIGLLLRSTRGKIASVGMLLFACLGAFGSRIPWKLGLASESQTWRCISYAVVILGAVPFLYVAILGVLFIIRYHGLKKRNRCAIPVAVTLTINDSGLIFLSENKTRSVAWKDINHLENIKGFYVFTCEKEAFFIPKSELPNNAQLFIQSQTHHKDSGKLTAPESSRRWSVKKGGRLVIFSVFLICLMAFFLTWLAFLAGILFL